VALLVNGRQPGSRVSGPEPVPERTVQPNLPETNRTGRPDVPTDVTESPTEPVPVASPADVAAAAAAAEVTVEISAGELPMPDGGVDAPDLKDGPVDTVPAVPQSDLPGTPTEPADLREAEAQIARAPRPARRPLKVHVPFLFVLLLAFAGVVRIAQYHWREGSVLIGAALMLAALLRAVLPTPRAGLIAVRGRVVDVLLYGGLAACVLFIAITLTNGPGA
jgi:hypothetical protein